MNNSPVLFIISGACSLGSQITLEWVKKPYQICITTPEIRQTKEFRQINPLGKVGAIKDGDNVVGENLAILLYLADNYDLGERCPKAKSDGFENIYQWLSYLSSTLHPAFQHFNYPIRFVDDSYEERFRELALARLHAQLRYINDSINEYGYLLTDIATIVDAQAFGLLRWCYKHNRGENLVDISIYHNLQKFFRNMQELPEVKNALAIESQQTELVKDSLFTGYFTINV